MKKLRLKYLSDKKIATWQNEIAAIYNTNIPTGMISVINTLQYTDEVESEVVRVKKLMIKHIKKNYSNLIDNDDIEISVDGGETIKKFKKGVWYTMDIGEFGNYYICYNGKLDNNYGFGSTRKWLSCVTMSDTSSWEEADMEVVKKLLLEKAKKDYPVGTVCDKFWLNQGKFVVCGEPYFDLTTVRVVDKRLEYHIDASSAIYNSGKWAVIIKDPRIMLGDVEVKIETDIERHSCFQSYTEYITTGKDRINTEHCLTWYNEIKQIRDQYLFKQNIQGNITTKLGEFDTKIPLIEGELCEIGCIKNIKFSDIENIIKAIQYEKS